MRSVPDLKIMAESNINNLLTGVRAIIDNSNSQSARTTAASLQRTPIELNGQLRRSYKKGLLTPGSARDSSAAW